MASFMVRVLRTSYAVRKDEIPLPILCVTRRYLCAKQVLYFIATQAAGRYAHK
jgi:hypothetical protein